MTEPPSSPSPLATAGQPSTHDAAPESTSPTRVGWGWIVAGVALLLVGVFFGLVMSSVGK